jgi:hypothetical protein
VEFKAARFSTGLPTADQRTVRLVDVWWNEEDRLMGQIYLDTTTVTIPME